MNPGTFTFRNTGVWGGGPIVKNRLFVFGTYENEEDKRPLTTLRAANPGEPEGGSGWELGDPYSGEGYEAAVAYAVAAALGFAHEEVDWIPNAVFEQAFAPGDKAFDWHMAQISIKPERQEAVDFSDPYFSVNQAVLAMSDNPIQDVTTIEGLKDFKLGAATSTTSFQLIDTVIQPNQEPQVFNSNADALQPHCRFQLKFARKSVERYRSGVALRHDVELSVSGDQQRFSIVRLAGIDGVEHTGNLHRAGGCLGLCHAVNRDLPPLRVVDSLFINAVVTEFGARAQRQHHAERGHRETDDDGGQYQRLRQRIGGIRVGAQNRGRVLL